MSNPAEQIRATANYYAAYFANRQVSNADVRAFQREIGAALDDLEAEHTDKVEFTRDEADIIYAALTLSWEPDYSEATAAARALLDERIGDKP